jgi:alkyl hydroperoxide reductase subunit AhpC
VTLVFYPEDWSPVCSDQLALYQQLLPEFEKFGAELVGVSVDGVWCHLAFAQNRNLHFPLEISLFGAPTMRRETSRVSLLMCPSCVRGLLSVY